MNLVDHGVNDVSACEKREKQMIGRVLSNSQSTLVADAVPDFYDVEQDEVNGEKPGTGLTYCLTPESLSIGPPEGSPSEPEYVPESKRVRFKQSKANKFNSAGLTVILPYTEEPRQLIMSDQESARDQFINQNMMQEMKVASEARRLLNRGDSDDGSEDKLVMLDLV